MRHGAVVAGVLGIFLAVLALTPLAEARAGGGISGGSRGSRSYSAPRSPSVPSSPATPSSPTSPQRSFGSPPPQRPGGLLGGWGGMLGGFLLGGLLGSMFFGGMGHGGGIGLLDLLLVAGLVWMAVAFFRRRQPEPALAGVPGGGWSAATTTAPVPAGGASVLDHDLEQGIAAVRMMDQGFDPVGFAGTARELLVRVQTAWSAGDLAPVRAEMTDEMAGVLERELGRLRTLRRVNRVERIGVEAADVSEAWQEYGQDFVTVRLRASALDYTTDATTGAVLDGSQSVPATFEEYWTFARPVGPHSWRLSAIQQPSA